MTLWTLQTLEVSDVASINFFKKTDGVELANLSGQKESQFLIGLKKLQKNFPLALHCKACRPVGYYINLYGL